MNEWTYNKRYPRWELGNMRIREKTYGPPSERWVFSVELQPGEKFFNSLYKAKAYGILIKEWRGSQQNIRDAKP